MEYTREKSVVHVVFLRTTNFSTFLARVHLVNIRATLGLACAQAATLCTQVVGNTRSYLSLLRVRVALNLRSLRIHPPRLCHFAVFSHRSRAGRPRALALPYGSGSLPASPRTISIESAQASCYTKIVTQDQTAREKCPSHTGPRIHSSTLLHLRDRRGHPWRS